MYYVLNITSQEESVLNIYVTITKIKDVYRILEIMEDMKHKCLGIGVVGSYTMKVYNPSNDCEWEGTHTGNLITARDECIAMRVALAEPYGSDELERWSWTVDHRIFNSKYNAWASKGSAC